MLDNCVNIYVEVLCCKTVLESILLAVVYLSLYSLALVLITLGKGDKSVP